MALIVRYLPSSKTDERFNNIIVVRVVHNENNAVVEYKRISEEDLQVPEWL